MKQTPTNAACKNCEE